MNLSLRSGLSRGLLLLMTGTLLVACGSSGSGDSTRVRNTAISDRISAGDRAANERRRDLERQEGNTRRENNQAFTPVNATPGSQTPGSNTPAGRAAQSANPIQLGGAQFRGAGGGNWQQMLFPLALLGVQGMIGGIGKLFGGGQAEQSAPAREPRANEPNAPAPEASDGSPGEGPVETAQNESAENQRGEQSGGRITREAEESSADESARELEEFLQVEESSVDEEVDLEAALDSSESSEEPIAENARREDEVPEAALSIEQLQAQLQEQIRSQIVWLPSNCFDPNSEENTLNEVFNHAGQVQE